MSVTIKTAAPQYPRIAFVGNCQAAVLGNILKKIAPERPAPLIVQSFLPVPDETRQAIREADIVVWQKTNTPTPLGAPDTTGKLIEFPWVSATFLWPYYGPAHINYRSDPPYTPYWGSEVGDRFLNTLIRDGVAPDDGLTRYLEHDHEPAKLDRAYEIAMEYQRVRDRHCGDYRTGDIIEAQFRSKPLFRTPSHPVGELTAYLAQATLPRIGLTADEQDRLASEDYSAHFPIEERPIHPQVAAHFGLEWATADRQYEICQDGTYTFTEWVLRYLRTEINEDIARGYYAFNFERDQAKGVALFQKGLLACPTAWRVRRVVEGYSPAG